MSPPAVVVEGLGKSYRLGGPGGRPAGNLRDAIAGAPAAWLRRLGGRSQTEEFKALDDVSFSIEPGERLAVIGRNGAGKSTLLKILARITEPSRGRVALSGRVASLLEVGTGFHPDLTGRENVFLNGAILGMSRAEISERFDEIVAFAETGRFLDEPVKHYSSGMRMRLAFAVAAHLESDILLVDEVLAVGDAQFQRKCLGKLGDLAQADRTVIFVSHNLGAVGRLCQRGLLLEGGRVAASGPLSDVLRAYHGSASAAGARAIYDPQSDKAAQILEAELIDAEGTRSVTIDRASPFRVRVRFIVRRPTTAHLSVMLDLIDGTPVCHATDADAGIPSQRAPGVFSSCVSFPGGILNAGSYQIRLGLAQQGGIVHDYREPFGFSLTDSGTFAAGGAAGTQRPGVLALALGFTCDRLDGEIGGRDG